MAQWDITEDLIMKKILMMLSLVFVVTFLACKPEPVVPEAPEEIKEGEYKPQERISKIYEDYGDGKKLVEVWKWNDSILRSTEHYEYWDDGSSSSWTEEFTYNKNGQIELVECFLNGEYTEYEYDGNKISKALFYDGIYDEGSVYMELDFKYTDNKITKIEVIGYDYKKGNGNRLMSKGYNPIKMLLTDKTYKVFEELVNNPINRGLFCTINLTWKDDNVSKIELKEDSYSIVVDLKYDDKSNPFRSYYPLYGPGVFYEEGVYDGELPFPTFSVNNVTEERWVVNDEGDKYTWLVKNSYSYEGMFPTTKRIFTQDEYGDTDTVVYYYEYE